MPHPSIFLIHIIYQTSNFLRFFMYIYRPRFRTVHYCWYHHLYYHYNALFTFRDVGFSFHNIFSVFGIFLPLCSLNHLLQSLPSSITLEFHIRSVFINNSLLLLLININSQTHDTPTYSKLITPC